MHFMVEMWLQYSYNLVKLSILAFNLLIFKEIYMSDEVRGSVLVVGGGIAGMQCALDAANSGYYVYLLEKSASVGGAMAQLDKTFPPNDCAM